MMKIIDYMKKHGHEQLAFCSDPQVGLNAVIAIHDTTLGPALGGARMWPYQSEDEAILDVLRLSRAMTYKASVAGLNLGGGKAVIIGDPLKDKSAGLFRSLGKFIESLGGRYITTEDVGTTVSDMQQIAAETKHVTGLPLAWGASGDPSPMTGFGIYQGMKACAKEVFGSVSLKGKTVAIQGFGKVGSYLAGHLRDEGVKMIVADVNEQATKRAKEEFGAVIVGVNEILSADCDIFAPCALGAVLNQRTIPKLKCKIVAGGANNQLEEDEDGDRLLRLGILYAPDYVINGGGIINLSLELTGYNAEAARTQVAEIYNTLEKVITLAKAKQISTARAADKLAQDRIDDAKRVRTMYLKR
ncbi:MAG TPA: Glu/Leu/Phe/Val dehydrogenase dimerization domain-containing protein [Dehalococcoidales bacterium]|nr:Glu/Leu/Phe/Val dehydrogenase dimerization domain-containing protein [Dehalococcoidales bacterium]